MDIKRAIIESKMVEVISPNEYFRRKSFGDETLLSGVCIEDGGILYPISSDDRDTPYAKVFQGFMQLRNTENSSGYMAEDKVVGTSNFADSAELIKSQNKLREEELQILTATQKHVYTAICREEDSPALIIAKECMTKKNIDPDNYKGRFESNCDYSNTMRLLNNPDNHTLSIQKLHDIGEKFDIEFTVIAKDKPDAPNPMNEVIERTI